MAARLQVALTGGIGSGKSTVAEAFARNGASLIDADQISHALTAAGGSAMPAILAAFGPRASLPSGALDRAWMREQVFANPAARKTLEGILHPLIRQQMLADSAQATIGPYSLLVIPLLFETGQQSLADRILVVDLPQALQIKRVRARDGFDDETIHRILASQVSRKRRLAGADDVIDNAGPPNALEPQIETLHRRYSAMKSNNSCNSGKRPQ